jgi:hypothetical protein
VLEEWGVTGLAEGVLLVVSELVSNAVAATAAASWEAGLPPVRLWALGGAGEGGGGQVLLLVWDAVPEIPSPRGVGLLDESGRGLHLAAAYSTLLDFYRPRWACGGKVARALIDRSAPLEDQLAAFSPAATGPGE